MGVNLVVLTGRFVADPEVKLVGQKSTAMCRFKLAVESRFLQNGEWKSKVNYPSCLAWGRQAEFIGNVARKGTFAMLVGRFETGSYEREGKTIYTNEVLVSDIEIPYGASDQTPKEFVPDEEIPF